MPDHDVANWLQSPLLHLGLVQSSVLHLQSKRQCNTSDIRRVNVFTLSIISPETRGNRRVPPRGNIIENGPPWLHYIEHVL